MVHPDPDTQNFEDIFYERLESGFLYRKRIPSALRPNLFLPTTLRSGILFLGLIPLRPYSLLGLILF